MICYYKGNHMIIFFGLIFIAGGVGLFIYGNNMNNNITAQLTSLFNTGSTNPGSVYITIGIVVGILGLIMFIAGILKKR